MLLKLKLQIGFRFGGPMQRRGRSLELTPAATAHACGGNLAEIRGHS